MLAENFEVKQIATLMDRSVASINSKLYDLGIKTKKSDYMWTKEEEDKLLKLYEEHNLMELSKLLNRSEASISYKSPFMNLVFEKYSLDTFLGHKDILKILFSLI